MTPLPFKLMLVTQEPPASWEDYLDFILSCCSAGVDAVQLRAKAMPKAKLIEFALALKEGLRKHKVSFIINDHLWLAQRIQPDGLHLGQKDTCIKNARDMLGNDMLLGLSVNSLHDVTLANALPVDYLGIGPIFPTRNKPEAKHPVGLNQLKEAVKLAKHPCIAIGGINTSNVSSVIQCAPKSIACIDAFHESESPTKTIAYFKQQLRSRYE